MSAPDKPAPIRETLPEHLLPAARRLSRALWNTTYRPGEGPLHYAGGTYWHHELLTRADRWEALAADARALASFLPATERESDAQFAAMRERESGS